MKDKRLSVLLLVLSIIILSIVATYGMIPSLVEDNIKVDDDVISLLSEDNNTTNKTNEITDSTNAEVESTTNPVDNSNQQLSTANDRKSPSADNSYSNNKYWNNNNPQNNNHAPTTDNNENNNIPIKSISIGDKKNKFKNLLKEDNLGNEVFYKTLDYSKYQYYIDETKFGYYVGDAQGKQLLVYKK